MENNELEFKPHKNMAERYSIESLAKNRNMTVDEFNKEMNDLYEYRENMIQKQISKGLTLEQSANHVLCCMYIEGFAGPTFKD